MNNSYYLILIKCRYSEKYWTGGRENNYSNLSVKVTNNTYKTEKGKIIRKKQNISFRIKNNDPRLLGQRQKQPKNSKRARDPTSSSSDGDNVPIKLAPRRTLIAESSTSRPKPSLYPISMFRPIKPSTSLEPMRQPGPAPSSTPVVDLTKSSSSSGGVIPPPNAESSPAKKSAVVEKSQQEQLISFKKATDLKEGALKEVPKKVTIATDDTARPDRGITLNSSAMTPISSDDDIIISPKRTPQEGPVIFSRTTAKTPTPGSSPTECSPETDTEAAQSSSKPPGRIRRQTKFYGSPIRHAVKEISALTVSPKREICGAVPVSAEELSASS